MRPVLELPEVAEAWKDTNSTDFARRPPRWGHTARGQHTVTQAYGTNQSPPLISKGPVRPVLSLQPTPVAESAADPGRLSKGAALCWGRQ